MRTFVCCDCGQTFERKSNYHKRCRECGAEKRRASERARWHTGKRKASERARRQTEEYKAKQRAYARARSQTEEYKAYRWAYCRTEERRAYSRAHKRTIREELKADAELARRIAFEEWLINNNLEESGDVRE